jgi:phosphohistidine phosphatase
VPLQLLILRSAQAEDKEAYALFGDSDDQRPLTDEGREAMAVGARALVRQFPNIDGLAAAPLDRGRETAEIVAEAYRRQGADPRRLKVPELSPGNPPMATLRWLRSQNEIQCLLLVGHEPDLSRFVSWLLVGSDKPLVRLEPGGACLLEFAKDVGAGAAQLCWCLTPGQLMELAELAEKEA